MAVIRFTELSLEKLKSESQTRYFDASLSNFGIVVGKKRKTFFCMTGNDRKLTTIGQFPTMTLAEARKEAHSLIGGTDAELHTQDPATRIREYVTQLDAGARWKQEQERLLKKHFLPTTTDLATTTKKDILAITDGLAATPSEQLHCHRSLKAFFNWCMARDHVAASPLNGLPLPTSQKSRSRVLQSAEIKRLWPATSDYGTYGLVIRACLLLGTRKGETTAILPAWIQDSTLVIPGTATKNGQEHILPLSPEAKAIVTQIAASVKPNWNSWNKLKLKMDAAAQLADWTIHDTRRYFSTTLAQLRILPHIIERLLNHTSGEISDVAATYNRYRYLPEMREALDLYQAHLATIIGKF